MRAEKSSLKRIGVLGGSFDPIHIAHLIVASEVGERFKLDRVVFVPTARPPHKTDRTFAPPEDRLEMVKLAVQSNPHFVVSEIEQKNRYAYTVETLRHLKRVHPGSTLYLIIGADNISEIKDWREPDQIFKLAKVVAVRRPNYDLSCGKDGYASRLILFKGPEIGISSTDIRRRIKSGKTFQYLVPEKVADYIIEKKLYR